VKATVSQTPHPSAHRADRQTGSAWAAESDCYRPEAPKKQYSELGHQIHNISQHFQELISTPEKKLLYWSKVIIVCVFVLVFIYISLYFFI
jgi:uncharacterized membrane protein YvbJ